MKRIETILREDGSIYGVLDYIECLQLKLNIIEGGIKEKLYYRNEHGGMDEIDEYGCSYHRDFPQVTELLGKIVQAQMKKRIDNREKQTK